MSVLKVSFTRPHHGWLPVRMEMSNQVVEFQASAVPTNPIEALFDAVAAAAGGGRGEVWWHLEPGGYYFELAGVGGQIRLRVLLEEQSMQSRKVEVASVTGSKADVLLPLWRALCQFESFDACSPHWPPNEQPDMRASLQRLREKIDAVASPSPVV